jgi:hypothetical protein
MGRFLRRDYASSGHYPPNCWHRHRSMSASGLVKDGRPNLLRASRPSFLRKSCRKSKVAVERHMGLHAV